MVALIIRDLKKNYGAVKVLHNINLQLEQGEFLVLLGPSGCGKSTLLNLIAGLEEITSGDIEIAGKRANDLNPKDRDIAMVFQSYALYPTMTVKDNIGFGLDMRGTEAEDRQNRIQHASSFLHIEELLDRRPAELSGGQRQRVAMARALVREPKLFLLDEPLSNLDAKLRTKTRSEIKKLHEALGATIVYVTHDQVEAMTLATRVAVMHAGHIQQLGSPMEIYHNPTNLFVAGFMGSPPMNLLNGRSDPTGAAIQIEGLPDIPMAAEKRLSASQAVVCGIRPEAAEVNPASDEEFHWNCELPIELVEVMGADTLLHFEVGGQELVARADGKASFSKGEVVKLAVKKEDLFFFDAETEKRL